MSLHIDVLPSETVEKIFTFLDGHDIATSRLVCKKWHRIIDTAPNDTFNKVHYETITVTAQYGPMFILEKHVDVEETVQKPKQIRESLTRTKIGSKLKLRDALTVFEFRYLMNYLRHLSTDKLVLQSLFGKSLLTMLLIFKRMCLKNKTLVFDFCSFKDVDKNTLINFLKPRSKCISEIQLSSCREIGNCLTATEFWKCIEPLSEPLSIIRIRDHLDEPWKKDLVALILGLPQTPWLIDIDGVRFPETLLIKMILAWVSSANNRNCIIKIDNCGIRINHFWNLIVPDIDVQFQPRMNLKVKERCFDGQFRFSNHYGRITFVTQNARLAVYMQR